MVRITARHFTRVSHSRMSNSDNLAGFGASGDMQMWQKVFVAVLAIALCIGCALFWIFARHASVRIDELTAQVERLSGDLDDARGELEALATLAARLDYVTAEFSNNKSRITDEYVQRVEKIAADDSACAWLDEPLPVSVRDTIEHSAGPGADDPPAAGASDAL